MSKKKDTGAVPAPLAKDGGQEDYEADSALRTLMEAEEHKNNPELMERVRKKAGRKMKALEGLSKRKISSLEELKKVRNEKALEGK